MPNASSLTVARALRALLVPGNPSVLHVVGLPDHPRKVFRSSDIVRVPLGEEGYSRMMRTIDASFARTGEPPAPQVLGQGLYGPSLFYRAVENFHLFNVCNHWVARQLSAAGLRPHPVAGNLAGRTSARPEMAVRTFADAARHQGEAVKVFLAGATGAIGRRLVLLLRRAGHDVVGTTRSESRAAALQALGAVPALVDVYDADRLKLAVYAVQPDVIVHQLTDLPQVIDPKTMPAALEANAKLRIEGTRNLVDAALANGVHRMIAQSIAFAYAPGEGALSEDHPINPAQTGVIALEDAVTKTPRIEGIVLRYGRLYGPGTWSATREWRSSASCRCRGAGGFARHDRGRARHLQYRRGRRRGVERKGQSADSASMHRSGSAKKHERRRHFARNAPAALLHCSLAPCIALGNHAGGKKRESQGARNDKG